MMITTITDKVIWAAVAFALFAPVLHASEISGTLNSDTRVGASSVLSGTLTAVTTTSSSEISGSLGGGHTSGSSISGTVTGGSSNTTSNTGGRGGGGGGILLAGTVTGGTSSGSGGGGILSTQGGSSLTLAASNNSDFGTGGGFNPELETFLASRRSAGAASGEKLAFRGDGNDVSLAGTNVAEASNNDLAAAAGNALTPDTKKSWGIIATATAVVLLLGYGISTLLAYRK